MMETITGKMGGLPLDVAARRARRWFSRARVAEVAAAARQLPADDGARAPAQVTVISMHESPAGGGERRRRLRWAGWIRGRVFHE